MLSLSLNRWGIRKQPPGWPATLNQKAIALAKDIHRIDSKAARWVAQDALRELTGSEFNWHNPPEADQTANQV
jgi:hypothetical protein